MPPESKMWPARIAGRRLLLRRPIEADAHNIFIACAQDPPVCGYMAWRPHASERTVREFVAACIAAWDSGVPQYLTRRVLGPIESWFSRHTVSL